VQFCDSKIHARYELSDFFGVLGCCPEEHRYETISEIKNGIFTARSGINIGSDFQERARGSRLLYFSCRSWDVFLRREEWRIRAMFL
jgi:hypothetical protein